MELKIWIGGRSKPKARGRAVAIRDEREKNKTRIKVYTDPGYRFWKNKAIAHFAKLALEGMPPLPIPCEIECHFCNFFSGDSDNLTGAILDALHQSNLIPGDSSSSVVGCSGKFYKVHKPRNRPQVKGVLILVRPAAIEWLSDELTQLIYSQISN